MILIIKKFFSKLA